MASNRGRRVRLRDGWPIIGRRQAPQSEREVQLEALLVEVSRWSRVAELNGDLHSRIASALAMGER